MIPRELLDARPYIKVPEAARILDVPRGRMYELLRQEPGLGVTLGDNQKRVNRDALIRYLEQRATGPRVRTKAV